MPGACVMASSLPDQPFKSPWKSRTMQSTMSHSETIVMSVGGSLIVPDAIDTTFLTNLKNFIVTETAKGRRFIIIAGGGKTARRYQDAAADVSELTSDDLDWMGIHATRLNGHLLRTIFRDIAHPVVITNPDEILDINQTENVIIAAGYRPGCSTDLRAVQIATRVNAKKVINLSNTDYVYTDNPNTNPDATKIENITWSEFRKLIPEEWGPGLSSPFDPVAAREAERLEIEVAQINGSRLMDVMQYLSGENFTGTRIH
jgi:uridylate kinase